MEFVGLTENDPVFITYGGWDVWRKIAAQDPAQYQNNYNVP